VNLGLENLEILPKKALSGRSVGSFIGFFTDLVP